MTRCSAAPSGALRLPLSSCWLRSLNVLRRKAPKEASDILQTPTQSTAQVRQWVKGVHRCRHRQATGPSYLVTQAQSTQATHQRLVVDAVGCFRADYVQQLLQQAQPAVVTAASASRLCRLLQGTTALANAAAYGRGRAVTYSSAHCMPTL